MIVSLEKTISPKSAALLGGLFCLPFLLAITTAITNFQPLLSLMSFHGRATLFGLIVFYIGLIGLPLAFLVNFLSMLSAKLAFKKWSAEGKISFHPKPLNLIIAIIGLCVALVFGGHLLLDSIACLYGNIPACD